MEVLTMANACKWRLVARYRQWIGKPDPTNAGTFRVLSNDVVWLREHAGKLERQGHKVYRIEENPEAFPLIATEHHHAGCSCEDCLLRSLDAASDYAREASKDVK
jgi:hypothetical protein